MKEGGSMKRILLAGLLAAITVHLWGFLSWAALPWHQATIHSLPNEDAVLAALRQHVNTAGVSRFPAEPALESDWQAFTEKYQRGPVGMMMYWPQGSNPMSPQPFVGALLLNLIAATLAAWLLSLAAAGLKDYRRRVAFVALIGVFAALVSFLTLWNWRFIPTSYALVMAGELILTWTLAGLVLAWRIKPAQINA